jgi:hypothetical protein
VRLAGGHHGVAEAQIKKEFAENAAGYTVNRML